MFYDSDTRSAENGLWDGAKGEGVTGCSNKLESGAGGCWGCDGCWGLGDLEAAAAASDARSAGCGGRNFLIVSFGNFSFGSCNQGYKTLVIVIFASDSTTLFGQKSLSWHIMVTSVGQNIIYDNDFTSNIDIHFYETFSTPNLWKSACASIFRTLSDVRIKVFMLLF